MPTFTPRIGLPQWIGGPPGVGDPISRVELNAAFLSIDNNIFPVICTSGTRPSTPGANMLIYETDTKLLMQRNAANSAWVMVGNIPSFATTGAIPTPYYSGQVVFITTGNVFYRYNGASWVIYSMFSHSGDASVTTAETYALTGYGNMATVGPAVTLTSVGAVALVIFGCTANRTSGTGDLDVGVSVEVSGVTTTAASDAWAGFDRVVDTFGFGKKLMSFVRLTITPGSNTYTLKYKCSGAVSATIKDRRIWVYAP